MAANQGSYNYVPFNPAPVMDVPSFTPSSSNHNQMPQQQPTHFQPAHQPQEQQHVQNNVHNVEPVAQNNQYSNPQVSKNKSVRPIPRPIVPIYIQTYRNICL